MKLETPGSEGREGLKSRSYTSTIRNRGPGASSTQKVKRVSKAVNTVTGRQKINKMKLQIFKNYVNTEKERLSLHRPKRTTNKTQNKPPKKWQ